MTTDTTIPASKGAPINPHDSSSTEAKAKSRIITHMNNDHQLELTRYLQHYAHLPYRTAAQSPQITDLTLTTLTIHTKSSSKENTYTIPWVPPLKSWADARTAAVNMDRQARAALGISDIIITEYVRPTLFHFITGCGVVFAYVSMLAQLLGFIAPGTWYYDVFLRAWFPGGPETYTWIQRMIWIPVVLIHVGEALWMDWKVQRFGVQRWSKLWWVWVGDNCLEGYGAHYRFDELVMEKEREKEAKKH